MTRPVLVLLKIFLLLGATLSSAETAFVDETHQKYDAEYRARLAQNEEIYQERTGRLAESYSGALERLRAELERRGVKPVAEAVQAEIDRLNAGDVGGYPEGTFLPDKVKHLRDAFSQFQEKLSRDAGNADAIALYQYDIRLTSLAADLQKAGNPEGQTALLGFREELLRPKEVEEVTPPDPDPVTPPTPNTENETEPNNPKQQMRKKRQFQRRSARNNGETSENRMRELMQTLPRPMSSDELSAQSAGMGAKPVADSDGSYPVLVASMSQVDELQPGKIEGWGLPQPEMVGDLGCWTVTVAYKVSTIFGTFDTQGKALVRGGKVIRWIYSGSGEEIQ